MNADNLALISFQRWKVVYWSIHMYYVDTSLRGEVKLCSLNHIG